MKLTLENLTKRYGDKAPVNSVNLSLTKGVYGLLGANGAGKTTLMRLICAVLKPTLGDIKLDGVSTFDMDEAYRDVLGYLPQDFGYYPDFTANEFLIYIGALKGIKTSKSKEKIDELLELVSLSHVKNKKIKTFSGGMKQRLGIAQAMLNDPKILVLDEPTAGLDPKERVRFRNLISDFSKDKIVILSTHIVSDIEYIANEILIMKSGQIIDTGTVEKLTQKVEGYVWSCSVSSNEVDELNEKYCISNLKSDGDKSILRIVSNEKPLENAKLVSPNLEDLYLYYFK